MSASRADRDKHVLAALAAQCVLERGGWATAAAISQRTGLSTQVTLARLARDGYAEVWTPLCGSHLYRVRSSLLPSVPQGSIPEGGPHV